MNVPFSFTGGYKLIDHDLSTISKITKLGLPKGQGVREGLGVTVFETEDGVLRQVRAGSNEATAFLLAGKLSLGDRAVVTVTVLVENVGVSVREGTALDILTGKTDMVSLVDQGCEGECLSSTPVNALAIHDGLLTGLEDLDNLVVEDAVGREDRDFSSDLVDNILTNSSVLSELIILDFGPFLGFPIFLLESKSL